MFRLSGRVLAKKLLEITTKPFFRGMTDAVPSFLAENLESLSEGGVRQRAEQGEDTERDE